MQINKVLFFMVVLIDTIFFPFGPILLIFVEHLESVLELRCYMSLVLVSYTGIC